MPFEKYTVHGIVFSPMPSLQQILSLKRMKGLLPWILFSYRADIFPMACPSIVLYVKHSME